jgi:hypothetical protein
MFDLNFPGLAISLPRLDLLARLLDLLEDGVVVERLCGDNLGGLGLKGDVVGLDAYITVSASLHGVGCHVLRK